MFHILDAVRRRPTCIAKLNMHVHVLCANQKWLVLLACDQLSCCLPDSHRSCLARFDEQNLWNMVAPSAYAPIMWYFCPERESFGVPLNCEVWRPSFCLASQRLKLESSCCRTDFLVALLSNYLELERLACLVWQSYCHVGTFWPVAQKRVTWCWNTVLQRQRQQAPVLQLEREGGYLSLSPVFNASILLMYGSLVI